MDAGNGKHASAGADGSPAPRTRRRVSTTPATRPTRRSLNLRIDEDVYERLTVHAMKRRTTISALVELLAREHLREFYVAKTPSRAGETNGNGSSETG